MNGWPMSKKCIKSLFSLPTTTEFLPQVEHRKATVENNQTHTIRMEWNTLDKKIFFFLGAEAKLFH